MNRFRFLLLMVLTYISTIAYAGEREDTPLNLTNTNASLPTNNSGINYYSTPISIHSDTTYYDPIYGDEIQNNSSLPNINQQHQNRLLRDRYSTCHFHPLKSIKEWSVIEDPYKFNYRQLIVPSLLIALGSANFYSDEVREFDAKIQKSLSIGRKTHNFDNYIQYAPIILTWGLDLMGVESRHKFKEQTTILALSALTMGIMVNGTKYATQRRRPNSSNTKSFPSGHTTMAFMGAEFLRMEFKDTSPWIGVLGYGLATTTAYMRVYNNKHWVTDTVAGAGVGILSVKIAYWLAPCVNKCLWGSNLRENNDSYASITPYSNGEQYGLSFAYKF